MNILNRTKKATAEATEEVPTPRNEPQDRTSSQLHDEVQEIILNVTPIKDQRKLDKRLKSIDLMIEYYSRRIEEATDEEENLAHMFKHFKKALQLSRSQIIQHQALIHRLQPLAKELRNRNGN